MTSAPYRIMVYGNVIKTAKTGHFDKRRRTISAFLTEHTSWITSLNFSHDSKILASGSNDHTVRLWDSASGQCLQTFKGHWFSVCSVTFSHDSKLIVSASSDDTIRVWDANSRQQPYPFESHAGRIWLYFSHDSTLLASAADDGPYDIKIWDTRNGRCLQRISCWSGKIDFLMFSCDLNFSHHIQVIEMYTCGISAMGSVCRLSRPMVIRELETSSRRIQILNCSMVLLV